MTDLVLWRHGQTDYNAQLRLQGQVDIPLNEAGRAQARAAAAGLAALRPTLLAASPLGRAQETAAILAEHTGLEVVTVEGLAERAFGVWETLSAAEIEAGWPEQYDRWRATGQDPEGIDVEPRAQVAERVGQSLVDLSEQAGPEGVVVAVSHGASITLGATRLLGLPCTWYGLHGMDNCHHAVVRSGRRAPGWTVIGWNLPGSLPGPGALQE